MLSLLQKEHSERPTRPGEARQGLWGLPPSLTTQQGRQDSSGTKTKLAPSLPQCPSLYDVRLVASER